MSNLLAITRRSSMPGLATVAFTMIGVALNQLTSLELGPRGQDFRVNLNLDVPAMQDVAPPLEKADAALGQMMIVLHAKPAPERGARSAWNTGAPTGPARPTAAIRSAGLQALPARPAPGQALPALTTSTQVLPAKPPSFPTAVLPVSSTTPAPPAQPLARLRRRSQRLSLGGAKTP